MKILITGGASGLGKQIVLSLQKNNSIDIIDKLSKDKLDQSILDNINDYYDIDLSDYQGINKFIESNNVNYDVLIINAFPRIFKNFEDFTIEEIFHFGNSAFINQIILINEIYKRMLMNNFGIIIIIGSKSHIKGYSSGSLYCSLKSAYDVFHESVSRELKQKNKNVFFSIIHPDSFSNISGSNINYFIIQNVIKKIKDLISHPESKVIYVLNFKTRILVLVQIFQKMLKLFK